MSDTLIEWTDNSWNSVTGCTRVSPGCANCYFLAEINRYSRQTHGRYAKEGEIMHHEDKLDEPHRWKKGKLIFVNSTSDVLHEHIPRTFLERMFATMHATPQHIYQVLTKRGERLARLGPKLRWTDNIWMGVSIEGAFKNWKEEHFHARIDDLRACGARHLFLSVEPLVGPVGTLNLAGIEWVIVGGESGKKARPMNLDWARDVVAQCKAAGVPVFVKQLGKVWQNEEARWYRAEKPEGWQEAVARLKETPAKGGQKLMDLWPEDLRLAEMPPEMEPYARGRAHAF